MSFIDLMSNNTYTTDEIRSRVVLLIRQKFSVDDEFKIERILMGSSLGRYVITAAEQAQIDAFEACALAARQEGALAKVDNALLIATIEYEQAIVRLALPALDPLLYAKIDNGTGTLVTNPLLVADTAERVAAQAVVAGASLAVTDLASLRSQAVTNV